jgi:hypothetical protein
MRVWTFQSPDVGVLVQKQPIYRADYSFPAPQYSKPFYEWMARQMESRGIAVGPHPPIWAWRPNTARPPKLITARMLLSDGELLRGVSIIELEVPSEFVLLTSYSKWCDIFFKSSSELPSTPDPELYSVDQSKDDDDTQACLPLIRREWVQAVRVLNLRPDDKCDESATV